MELEKILEDLFLFKPQEPTITTQIPTYSIKDKGSDNKYNNLSYKNLLYVNIDEVNKKIFYDVNGKKLQVYINNHNELYYINPEDGKNYSINNNGNFYYYDSETKEYNSCHLSYNKFYKFYGSDKEIKQYEKIEKFSYQDKKIKLDISQNKNQQVELTFDFVKQMKKEVEKIKKQCKKLSQRIEENEYLTALKEIYKNSCNKYTRDKCKPFTSYISKKDESRNDILVISPANQDDNSVDYFLKYNAYSEKIKKDLQKLMETVNSFDESTKQQCGFIENIL